VLIHQGTDVTGLIRGPGDTDCIAGVRLRSRTDDAELDRGGRELAADLVVVADGRKSRLPEWLTALGYEPPGETVVNAFQGYASRFYRPPAAFEAGWKALYIQQAPPGDPRGGLVSPVEGGRWLVSLVGGDGFHPPTDEAGFLAFARSLRSPALYEAIVEAEPLTSIAGQRATENRVRHYDRLGRFPDGVVGVGDAVCAFNPVYGQGMTAAALGAEVLDRWLREGSSHRSPGRGRVFQLGLARVTAAAWKLSTGADYRFRTTEGPPQSRVARLTAGHVARVMRAATRRPCVRQRLAEVLNLVRPPRALLGPGVIARLAWDELAGQGHARYRKITMRFEATLEGESSMYEPKLIAGRVAAGAQRPSGREERSRHRIGILSFSSPGHFYPLTALGRRLQSRGHEVVYFQVADLEGPIRAAGLEFRQIGREDFPPGSIRARDDQLCKLKGGAALRCALRGIELKARMLFRDAPAAIRDEGVDSLIIDQIEMAGGTVAEHLGLPFVSAAAALPINRDASVPPAIFPWSHRAGVGARLRNWVGNAATEWIFSGTLQTINRQRQAWGLAPCREIDALFSRLAQVAQLPAALELPGRRPPPHVHHTGPWTDAAGRAPVDFPWSRLDLGRPLVYASMGTLQNGVLRTFRTIAEACAGLDLQLVISLGGGQDPTLLGDLPGDPVVVGYAPQLDLIRRSALTISHGGLNTALESLAQGVPMVVLPVAYDQPGVGARVEWSGVGRSIPVGRLTVDRLRDAVRTVMGYPPYRERAGQLCSSIEAADGLNRAADLIEGAFRGRALPMAVARSRFP
jgi:zeaxanthin glucosyltransferase